MWLPRAPTCGVPPADPPPPLGVRRVAPVATGRSPHAVCASTANGHVTTYNQSDISQVPTVLLESPPACSQQLASGGMMRCDAVQCSAGVRSYLSGDGFGCSARYPLGLLSACSSDRPGFPNICTPNPNPNPGDGRRMSPPAFKGFP